MSRDLTKATIAKSLMLLTIVACGSDINQVSEVNAVRDRTRVLGLVAMSDGSQEFRLCRPYKEYTPKIIAEECINPFVTEDGQALTLPAFSDLPMPNRTALQLRDVGTALVVGIVTGAIIYRFGRYYVRNKAAASIAGQAAVNRTAKGIDKLDLSKFSDIEKGVVKEFSEEGSRLQKLLKTNKDGKLVETEKLASINDLISAGDSSHTQVIRDGETLAHFQSIIDDTTKSADEIEKAEKAKEALKDRITAYNEQRRQSFETDMGNVEEAILKYGTPEDAKKVAEDAKPDEKNAKKVAEEAENVAEDAKPDEKKKNVFSKVIDGTGDRIKGSYAKLKDYFAAGHADWSDLNKIVVKERDKVVNTVVEKGDLTAKSGVELQRGAEKLVGETVGFAAFIGFTFTELKKKLPGHAQLSAASHWKEATSDYDEITRVEDLQAVLDGVALAVGAKVTHEALVFGR